MKSFLPGLCPSHLLCNEKTASTFFLSSSQRLPIHTEGNTIWMLNWEKNKKKPKTPQCNGNTKWSRETTEVYFLQLPRSRTAFINYLLTLGSGGARGTQLGRSGAAILLFTRLDLSGLFSSDTPRSLQAKWQTRGAEMRLPRARVDADSNPMMMTVLTPSCAQHLATATLTIQRPHPWERQVPPRQR